MDIFSRSGDIRDQSLKWSKIDRNFACFWPQIFRGGGRAPRIFGVGLQNPARLRPCGKVSGRSVEGSRRTSGEKEDTSAVKHKPVPSGTVVLGGLINKKFSVLTTKSVMQIGLKSRPRPKNSNYSNKTELFEIAIETQSVNSKK